MALDGALRLMTDSCVSVQFSGCLVPRPRVLSFMEGRHGLEIGKSQEKTEIANLIFGQRLVER